MSLKWIKGSEVRKIDAKKEWVEVAEGMRKDSETKNRRYELNLSGCTRGIVHHVPH